MDTRVCPFLPDGASISPLERAILEKLDVADKPVDQGVLYSQLLTELGTGARAYDVALSHLIALELIDCAFDQPDEHHLPLDESRFVLSLVEGGIETLAAFWRAEAKAKSIAEAIPPAMHVDETKLAITSPAFAVRFETREAMRAYMSGGAA